MTLKQFSLKAISTRLATAFPKLKRELWIAQINKTPEVYLKEKLKMALMGALVVAVLTFFFVDKRNGSYFMIFFNFIIAGLVFFFITLNQAKAIVERRRKNIDREVLFAGRFLLVKLNSGKTLINALEDAAESYGSAGEYFKSIIREIDTGMSLEDALDKGIKFCPSPRMKKILFQISNALKIGIDVTQSLGAALDQIADEQIIEIQKYGKRLNSLTMFYMLGAVVLPSLGLTIFVIVASITNISMDITLFGAILFGLIVLEFMFMTIFKSIRPNVHI